MKYHSNSFRKTDEDAVHLPKRKDLHVGCNTSPYGAAIGMPSNSLRNSVGAATHFREELLVGMPFTFLQTTTWDATHVPEEFPWRRGEALMPLRRFSVLANDSPQGDPMRLAQLAKAGQAWASWHSCVWLGESF